MKIVFSPSKRRPGCVLLQAAMGGDVPSDQFQMLFPFLRAAGRITFSTHHDDGDEYVVLTSKDDRSVTTMYVPLGEWQRMCASFAIAKGDP
jgi:hypothetical protein